VLSTGSAEFSSDSDSEDTATEEVELFLSSYICRAKKGPQELGASGEALATASPMRYSAVFCYDRPSCRDDK